jgi:streptogramin lyase
VIWFSYSSGRAIGSLTPDGVLKRFRVPWGPIGSLTSDSSGSVWFVTPGRYIAKVTSPGHFKRIRMPFNVAMLAPGKSGLLFVANSLSAGQPSIVGRLNLAGRVVNRTPLKGIPDSAAFAFAPSGLTFDDRGGTWVTGSPDGPTDHAADLLRISRQGNVQVILGRSVHQLFGLMRAADGSIWLGDQLSRQFLHVVN